MTETLTERPQAARRVAALAAIWAGAAVLASATGLLRGMSVQAFGALVAVLLVAAVASYFVSPSLRAVGARVGLRWLTALHVWRIGAALVFFAYGAEQLLPGVFVRLAGWGDFMAGVLALLTVTLLSRQRWAYWTAHVLGLGDFVLAVGTGVTLSVIGAPLMETIRTFPVAVIPLFGVPVSGLAHVMAFDLLRQGRGPGG